MKKRYLRKIIQTDERMAEVLKLSKEKKYDEIFKIYGKEVYNTVAPKKYKEKDVINLIKQGNFEEVYVKYGEKVYKRNLDYIKAQKKYLETGKKTPVIINRIKNNIIHKIFPTALSTTLLLPATVGTTLAVQIEMEKENNAIVYKEEIEDYNKKITEYAKQIQSMNLDDMHIIMKVMSDMWDSIEGYGKPKKDILGYHRLDLSNEGVGVCRNMADDVTAKLNAINPEYNARNMVCYIDGKAGIEKFADIDRPCEDVGNIQTEEEAEKQNEQNEQSDIEMPEILDKLLGNHIVTVIDLPGKNISMVVDPTNAALGVFKDGKVYMSFSKTGEGIQVAPAGQCVFFSGNIIEVGSAIVKSLIPTELTVEEIEQLYGVEAQNKTLEELQEIYNKEGGNKALEILKNNETHTILDQVEFQDPNKQFREKYQIKNPTENPIQNNQQENNEKSNDIEQER